MANPCFDCKRALGGCPWSLDFTPVPGWEATPAPGGSYEITFCPLFEYDKPRPYVGGVLTEEEEAEFLDAVQHERMVERKQKGFSPWVAQTEMPRSSKKRKR